MPRRPPTEATPEARAQFQKGCETRFLVESVVGRGFSGFFGEVVVVSGCGFFAEIGERGGVFLWGVGAAHFWCMSVFRFVRVRSVVGTAQSFQQASAAALAALAGAGDVRLVAARTSRGLFQGVDVAGGGESVAGVVQLARAVGARAVRMSDGFSWRGEGDYVVVVRARRRQSLGFAQSQNGLDPVGLMDTVAAVLAPGSWLEVAVSRPARFEQARWRRWLSVVRAGLVTHPSTSTSTPVLVSIYAGAGTRRRAEAVVRALTAAIPGFDVDCVIERVSSRWAGVGGVLAGAGLAGAARCRVVADGGVVRWVWWAAWVCFVVGVLRAVGVVRSRWVGWRRCLPSPRRARRVRVDVRRLMSRFREDGSEGVEVVPAWPVDAYALMLAPGQIAGIVAPQSSAGAGREVPGELRGVVGPLVGRDKDGCVYLPDSDVARGLAVVGSPGSGKSVLLQSVAGYLFLEQAAPSGRRGAPGAHNAVIVFDPKREGVEAYRDVWEVVASKVGRPNPLYVVDLADPACPVRVGLVREGSSAFEQAEAVTDAVERAFDAGAVGAASKEALITVLWAGHYVDEEVLRAARAKALLPAFASGGSFVFYGHVLLGGHGDEAGVALASALRDKLLAPGACEEYRAVASRLETLYGRHTPAQRDQQTKAPRNKLAQLVGFDHLFRVDASTMSFETVLYYALNVVFLTGPSGGHAMSEGQAELLSALLSNRLKNATERMCSGWSERGWFSTVIVDELLLLARATPETLRWNRDQGRSYGRRPVYATQYPGQVSPELRTSLLTFPAFVSFKADEASIAVEVAAQMGIDGSVWDAADIATLEPHHVAVRTSVDFAARPAFTTPTVWWRESPDQWVRAHLGAGACRV